MQEAQAFKAKVKAEGFPLVLSSTIALAYRLPYGTFAHLASGVLFKVADRKFLLTNAHVIDEVRNKNVHTSIPGVGRTGIELSVLASKIPEDGTRDDDYLDMAVCEILNLDEQTLKHTFLRVPDLDCADDQHSLSLYVVYGYAKDSLDTGKYIGTSWTSRLYDKSRGTPTTHVSNREILMPFPAAGGVNDYAGNAATLPCPKGMSGCGIWRLLPSTKNMFEWTIDDLKLVAIQFAWGEEAEYLRGTRISYFVHTIRENYPDLRDALQIICPR